MDGGSFSYILLLEGKRIPLIISRFLLNRGSLNQGSEHCNKKT